MQKHLSVVIKNQYIIIWLINKINLLIIIKTFFMDLTQMKLEKKNIDFQINVIFLILG